MSQKLLLIGILTLLIGLGLMGCSSQSQTLTPVEEEQIENVVKDYVIRDTEIPDYTVTIEEVSAEWARVSVIPVGVEGGASTLYLQKQVEGTTAPTATVARLPGHEARASTSTGWAIILGPQAEFAEATLDEVGVPSDVRPSGE